MPITSDEEWAKKDYGNNDTQAMAAKAMYTWGGYWLQETNNFRCMFEQSAVLYLTRHLCYTYHRCLLSRSVDWYLIAQRLIERAQAEQEA